MQDELTETDQEVMANVATIFAELCAKEMIALEAKPPRLHGSWGKIGQIFENICGEAETCAAVEARRLEAVHRYHAVRERFQGAPPQFELEGWTDQAWLGR